MKRGIQHVRTKTIIAELNPKEADNLPRGISGTAKLINTTAVDIVNPKKRQ